MRIVFSGWTGAVVGACDDDSGGVQSRVAFATTAGTTYYLLVTSYVSAGGTLEAGDILVMGGLPHAWENIYDEDCTYVFVTVGATGSASWI